MSTTLEIFNQQLSINHMKMVICLRHQFCHFMPFFVLPFVLSFFVDNFLHELLILSHASIHYSLPLTVFGTRLKPQIFINAHVRSGTSLCREKTPQNRETEDVGGRKRDRERKREKEQMNVHFTAEFNDENKLFVFLRLQMKPI